jgi:hypothetical protein
MPRLITGAFLFHHIPATDSFLHLLSFRFYLFFSFFFLPLIPMKWTAHILTTVVLFLCMQFIILPAQAADGEKKCKKTVCNEIKKKTCPTPDCSKPPCTKAPCATKIEKAASKAIPAPSKSKLTPVNPRSGNINAIPDIQSYEIGLPLPLVVKNGAKYGDLTSYYAYADR